MIKWLRCIFWGHHYIFLGSDIDDTNSYTLWYGCSRCKKIKHITLPSNFIFADLNKKEKS